MNEENKEVVKETTTEIKQEVNNEVPKVEVKENKKSNKLLLILLPIFLVVIGACVIVVLLLNGNSKYKTFEDDVEYSAMFYKSLKKINFNYDTLNYGLIKISDIRETSSIADDIKECDGYVKVTLDGEDETFKAYITCGNKYTTEGYDPALVAAYDFDSTLPSDNSTTDSNDKDEISKLTINVSDSTTYYDYIKKSYVKANEKESINAVGFEGKIEDGKITVMTGEGRKEISIGEEKAKYMITNNLCGGSNIVYALTTSGNVYQIYDKQIVDDKKIYDKGDAEGIISVKETDGTCNLYILVKNELKSINGNKDFSALLFGNSNIYFNNNSTPIYRYFDYSSNQKGEEPTAEMELKYNNETVKTKFVFSKDEVLYIVSNTGETYKLVVSDDKMSASLEKTEIFKDKVKTINVEVTNEKARVTFTLNNKETVDYSVERSNDSYKTLNVYESALFREIYY